MITLLALLLSAVAVGPRETAVLVYPKERSWFRRVFYSPHQDALQERLRRRYDLRVHEQVATDDELFAIDVRGAKVLVLSGHGDPFAMFFASRKERTLDSSDHARLERFLTQLDPGATIVLQSCHTGRGFAHLVKSAAGGRRVIAATGEVPPDGMEIVALTPLEVTMTCTDGRDCTIRL
ncbi:MAG TPA: hypothetical protein VNL91_04030 [Thermoanaerobaculia bacterium]|nr:hypothetical protein [Thermoanaerobaculia bacterium]